MIQNAEVKTGARLAAEHDDRILPVGHFLRRTRLDELPQLFNIWKGEMSIVGPRPERPELAEIEKEIPEFCYRLKMKAGLTGYAQVYGKYNTTSYDKLKLDLTYIRNYSLLLDLKLILMTPKIMMLKESTEGETMEKLLTVVIPAYNAEKYITYTLDSLCAGCRDRDLKKKNQSWTGNETESNIQTVSARMPDFQPGMDWLRIHGNIDYRRWIKGSNRCDCRSICGRYPTVVRVIHKENGGHGSGINCGIQNALGRYMKVVDADDWVDPEALDHLIAALKNCRDDVLVSGFYWRFDNGSGEEAPFRKSRNSRTIFRGEIGISYEFDGIADQIYMKMHGITWRTEILRQMPLSIDEHCYYVDAEYILYPIPWVKTVSFIPDFVYQYRIGREGQSVSPEKMIRNKENYDRVMESLLSFYRLYQGGTLTGKTERSFHAVRKSYSIFKMESPGWQLGE